MSIHSRYNREILASITFEPLPKQRSKDTSTPPRSLSNPSSTGGPSHLDETSRKGPPHHPFVEPHSDSQPPVAADEPNEETKLIITCMKLALSKSIANISLPDKDRPLDPRKDFTIASTISFKGPKAPSTKQRKQRLADDEGDNNENVGCCSSKPKRTKPLSSKKYEPQQPGSPPMVAAESGNDVEVQNRRSLSSVAPRGVAQNNEDGEEEEEEEDLSSLDEDEDESKGKSCKRCKAPASFVFTDYSPMCYRHIREFFDVDSDSYRQVLCQSTWHSVPTPGKSAAQLFFCGQNWVIKTMTNQESDFLRNILHKYYYHTRDNPHTLLPHFVGHHMIELNGKRMTFVIMQNVFATTNKIHEKYDLKGSTVGRFATKAEKMKQTCTQKDLDINRPILVGSCRRQLVTEQMKKDCDFLKRGMIMDYSLLVGIHVIPRGAGSLKAPTPSSSTANNQGAEPLGETGKNPLDDPEFSEQPAPPSDGKCFTSDQGGMMSSDEVNGRREIYYIGIIDILQEYTLWKRSETVVQGIRFDSTQISSVHPVDYASRFLSFMSSLLV